MNGFLCPADGLQAHKGKSLPCPAVNTAAQTHLLLLHMYAPHQIMIDCPYSPLFPPCQCSVAKNRQNSLQGCLRAASTSVRRNEMAENANDQPYL